MSFRAGKMPLVESHTLLTRSHLEPVSRRELIGEDFRCIETFYNYQRLHSTPRLLLAVGVEVRAQTITSTTDTTYSPVSAERGLQGMPPGYEWVTHMTERELHEAFSGAGLAWKLLDRWGQHSVYELHPS